MSWMKSKIITKTLPTKESSLCILTSSPEAPRSLTIGKTDLREVPSASKEDLEKLYSIDGLTGRIVDKYIEKIWGSGYDIIGSDQEISKEIGNWSKAIDIDYIGGEILRDIFITGAGNAWCELGYNKEGTDISTIKIINPKMMDFLRDSSKKIEYDTDLRPKGYVFGSGLASRVKVTWEKDKITSIGDKGEQIDYMNKNQDGRDRIAHFKLIGLGEMEEGISPVARSFKSALVRLNLEHTVGDIASRSSSIMAEIGREDQPPESISESVLESTKKELEKVDSVSIFVFRRTTKISPFPTPDPSKFTDLLYYFADLYTSSLGVKLPLILQPARGYRGDIEIAQLEFLDTVKLFQNRLAIQVKNLFFKRLLKARGIQESLTPNIVFKLKDQGIALSQSRRIATYARRNLISYDPELEKFIRDQEGLPTSFVDKLLAKWSSEGKLPEITREVDRGGGELDVREIKH